MTFIKFCGMTRVDDVHAAFDRLLALGATALLRRRRSARA